MNKNTFMKQLDREIEEIINQSQQQNNPRLVRPQGLRNLLKPKGTNAR